MLLSVSFTDVAGYQYTATVDNVSSTTSLTAASSPFVVEEDDNDDPMTPVRTSSGYLTVKCDDDDIIDDIMPGVWNTRKVQLTKYDDGGGVVVWSGYVKPETYENTLFRKGEDVQIPVFSQLAVLGCLFPEHDEHSLPTFAEVIYGMLTYHSYNSFYNVYFATSSTMLTNLRMRFCWNLFFEMSEDMQYESKYTCLQILEEICKFWGLTLREQGRNLIFQSVDEKYSSYVMAFTWDNFRIWAQGGNDNYNFAYYGNNSITNQFNSLSQTVSMLQGVKKVVVESNPNSVSSIFNLNCQDFMEKWKSKSVRKSGNDDDGYLFVLEGTYDNPYPSDTQVSYDNWIVTLHETGDRDAETDAQINYAAFYAFEFYDNKIAYKYNYNFEYWIVINGGHSNDLYLVKAESLTPIALSNCYLVIDAEVMYLNTTTKDRSAKNIKLKCMLRIGDSYWTGSSWGSSYSEFTIDCGYDDDSSEGIGKIKCTRYLDSAIESYTGHGIAVNSAICGIVEFRILSAYRDIDGTINWSPIHMRNLRLSVANRLSATAKSNRKKNRYTEVVGNFEQEYNINTMFCTSNNNEWGIGLLLTNYLAVAQDARYYMPSGTITYIAPEQELLRRVKTFRNVPRKIFNLSLQYDKFANCKIFEDFYVSSADKKCAMLSYKYDFAENEMKVKLIERK